MAKKQKQLREIEEVNKTIDILTMSNQVVKGGQSINVLLTIMFLAICMIFFNQWLVLAVFATYEFILFTYYSIKFIKIWNKLKKN